MSFKLYAIALYDYVALEHDQLSFAAGHVLAIVHNADTSWWGGIDLDTAASGWVPVSYIQPLDSPEDADAVLQARANPDSLAARLSRLELSAPTHDDVSDRQSIISTGGVSLASVATYGSMYPPTAAPRTDLPGGVDAFLRQQRFHTDVDSTNSGSGAGSASGSGSSNSTIVSYLGSRSQTTNASASVASFSSTTSSSSGAPSAPPSRPGLIIPPTRLTALRDSSPASTSPTRSISMTSTSSGRSARSTGITTPSSHHSQTPTPLRNPKVVAKLLGLEEVNAYDNAIREDSGEPTPWFLQPSFGPDELRFASQQSGVEAGTLDALVEWLTTPRPREKSRENAFRETFLSTYRTFTDAHTLVDMLVKRYEMEEPPDLDGDEFEQWKDRKLRPVQMQILMVFKGWMTDHHLLESEPDELPRVKEFLSYVKTPEKNERIARSMIDLITKASMSDRLLSPTSPASSSSSSSIRRKKSAVPTVPFLRRSGGSSSSSSSTSFSHTKLAEALKFDPMDIASQLARMEHSLYSRISANDLIEYSRRGENSWNSWSASSSAPLDRFFALNRRLSMTVQYLVLNADTVQRRRDVLVQLIRVVERCRTQHTYAAVHALMTGLAAPALAQLTFTWASVDRAGTRMLQLRELVSPDDNWAALRKAAKSVGNGSCVPFLGKYLPVLKNYDQQPDTVPVVTYNPHAPSTSRPVRTLINFKKRRWMWDVCRDALRFQGQIPADTDPNTPGSTISVVSSSSSGSSNTSGEIAAWVEEQLDAAGSLPDEWFSAKSLEVQRREEDHSDISMPFVRVPPSSLRKGLEAAGF